MTVARLRLGGMQPAELHETLPKTYYVSSVMDTYYADEMVFCYHCHNKPGVKLASLKTLVWIEQRKVILDGVERNLFSDPTWRNHWTVFTLEKL